MDPTGEFIVAILLLSLIGEAILKTAAIIGAGVLGWEIGEGIKSIRNHQAKKENDKEKDNPQDEQSPMPEDGVNSGKQNDEKGGKLKSKERRKLEQNKSRESKHGDLDWEEPASEEYAKWKARTLEKERGKDARREGHDRKQKGEGDRSKSRLQDDYE